MRCKQLWGLCPVPSSLHSERGKFKGRKEDCKYMELSLSGAFLQLLPLPRPAALGGRCSELHLWAWNVTDALSPVSRCDPLRVTPRHIPWGFHRVPEP